MSTYDFEPDPDDFGPEPAHIANYVGARRAYGQACREDLIALVQAVHKAKGRSINKTQRVLDMTPLQKAAQAMIDRWESTDWKDTPHTAHYVAELRKALDKELAQSVEPYAVFHGLVDSGEHGAFNLDLLKMIPRGAYLYLRPPQPQATTPAVPDGYALVPIEPTEAMVDAYLAANTAYWLRTDELPKTDPSRWRQGTPSDATAESYRAMINAAQGEKP